MKKIALVAGLVMFYLLSILVASNLSAKSALKSQWGTFETELDKMQNELALRHLLRYRELQSNLEQGCKNVVLEKLKISVAIESTLISSSLQKQKTSELSEFLAKQAPSLALELPGYKSPYGSSWTEPKCK